MKSTAWGQVGEIFMQALSLPESARSTYVAEASKGNAEIREEVLGLLESQKEAGDFMEISAGSQILVSTTMTPFDDEDDRDYLSLKSGDEVGDFRVIRELGAGAFAKVYLAEQLSLGRRVALKVSANFGDEARTMAPLEHDNIVKVFSETSKAERKVRMICMQYVPGINLHDVLSSFKADQARYLSGENFINVIDQNVIEEGITVSPSAVKNREELARYDYVEACLSLGSQLADALDYAHKKGVLHLDIKPSNVILSSHGRPMLMDFNVSSSQTNLRQGTPDNFGGTFEYMAPEQAAVFESKNRDQEVRKIDHRADIFSLGVVLREMLTKLQSQRTTDGKTGKARLLEILNGPLPGVSIEARSILECATKRDPGQRFFSAAKFSSLLKASLELQGIRRKLPSAGALVQIVAKNPLLMISILSALPQFAATYISVTYNSIQIVNNLNAEQQALFNKLLFVYNPILYVVGFALWAGLLLPIYKFLRKPGEYFHHPDALVLVRKRALRLPDWTVFITALGWLPGSILFPIVIHQFEGPITSDIFAHFIVSFWLSCLVAASYSLLIVEYLVLRVLYPRMWLGTAKIRDTATQELSGRWTGLRFFHFMPSLSPLFGATLILLIGPHNWGAHDMKTGMQLILFLVSFGMVGVVFGSHLSNRLTQLTDAFMGDSKS